MEIGENWRKSTKNRGIHTIISQIEIYVLYIGKIKEKYNFKSKF